MFALHESEVPDDLASKLIADKGVEVSRLTTRIAELEAALAASQAAHKAAVDAERNGLPRLTEAMIRAACMGHYGSDNIDGIDLTNGDINYNFRAGFRRMWAGIRAARTIVEGGE